MLEPESELYNSGIVDVSHRFAKIGFAGCFGFHSVRLQNCLGRAHHRVPLRGSFARGFQLQHLVGAVQVH